MGADFASVLIVMPSRVKGTDKKSGFELLEHVTGGVHISTSPDNGRVVHRPLDYLNDANVVNCEIAPDDPEHDPEPPSKGRRRQKRHE
jgi:hypothetical protein